MKGVANQGSAWFLMVDICSYDRTDHVMEPAQVEALESLIDDDLLDNRPPIARNRRREDEDDYRPWNWLTQFGSDGTLFYTC